MSSIEERISELIGQLPPEMEELVRLWMPVLEKAAKEEIQAWAKLMAEGDYVTAHKNMIATMTTNEIIKDGQAIVDAMAKLNAKSVSENKAWENFFSALVAIAIEKYLGIKD